MCGRAGVLEEETGKWSNVTYMPVSYTHLDVYKRQILATVKKMGLESRMEYITFSLHAMKEFIRLAPAGTPVF